MRRGHHLRSASVKSPFGIAGLVVLILAPALAEVSAGQHTMGPNPGLSNARQTVLDLEHQALANQARLEQLQARYERQQTRLANAARSERVREIIDDLVAEGDFRETHSPPLMQVGYDKGFYIKSSDATFLLKVNGYTRVRWTGQNRQTDDPRRQGRQRQPDINGFEIEDFRLKLSGYLHSPRLSYEIVADADMDAASAWTTYAAWISYRIGKELSVTAGLGKVPFGRQELVSKSALQFIDRSVANEVFNLDRAIGMAVHGTLADRFGYEVAVTNGLANPDASPSREQLDTNFAYTARLVTHLLGEPINTESDLAFCKDPRLETGLSLAYNDNNGDQDTTAFYSLADRIRRGRGIGGGANADVIGTDLLQLGADVAYRYQGFSVTAEYWLRTLDGDTRFSPWQQRTPRSDAMHQQGGYLQVGYFVVPKTVELATRLAGVWDNGGDNVWELAVGASYFPWQTRTLVLQADYTRLAEAPSTSRSANWSQNDEVDMVRVQMVVRF